MVLKCTSHLILYTAAQMSCVQKLYDKSFTLRTQCLTIFLYTNCFAGLRAMPVQIATYCAVHSVQCAQCSIWYIIIHNYNFDGLEEENAKLSCRQSQHQHKHIFRIPSGGSTLSPCLICSMNCVLRRRMLWGGF